MDSMLWTDLGIRHALREVWPWPGRRWLASYIAHEDLPVALVEWAGLRLPTEDRPRAPQSEWRRVLYVWRVGTARPPSLVPSLVLLARVESVEHGDPPHCYETLRRHGDVWEPGAMRVPDKRQYVPWEAAQVWAAGVLSDRSDPRPWARAWWRQGAQRLATALARGVTWTPA